MPPANSGEGYQILKNRLYRLDTLVADPDPDGEAILGQAIAIQQEFTDGVLAVPPDEQTGTKVSRIQSLRTETHKQLRLLVTDAAFLRSAKQADTRQQRQQQIRDRLQTLMGYCEVGSQV